MRGRLTVWYGQNTNNYVLVLPQYSHNIRTYVTCHYIPLIPWYDIWQGGGNHLPLPCIVIVRYYRLGSGHHQYTYVHITIYVYHVVRISVYCSNAAMYCKPQGKYTYITIYVCTYDLYMCCMYAYVPQNELSVFLSQKGFYAEEILHSVQLWEHLKVNIQ